MAPKTAAKTVNPDVVASALAKAVAEGDIVNFRFLSMPFSPARIESTERFEDPTYSHLLPGSDLEGDLSYKEALALARQPDVWAHVEAELAARKPPQLHSKLVMALADNAVRLGKYTSASQAYELLRIRVQMQDEFFAQSDALLDAGNIKKAVQGYLIATGLDYDYAAFPEPLPAIPDFQTRGLVLHADYPADPNDSLPMWEPDRFLRTALAHLLLSAEAGARLDARPHDVKLQFLAELVKARDPNWREFVARFRDALKQKEELDRKGEWEADGANRRALRLAEEIAAQYGEAAGQIPAILLGRAIAGGTWWQYLKDIAYQHPAAPLFLARQMIGNLEILVPRYRSDSPIPSALGLVPG